MSTTIEPTYTPGSLVRARGREWVVLPDDPALPGVLMLRPLGGTDADATGLLLALEGDDLAPATFAPPTLAEIGDSVAARLLRDAVRLNFRAGAGPFRSLGRIAVEPRAYQLVPLLMALRLDPVRLLIADDVGIGKTIEAGLIARELLDRGEIRRLAVVCPPHLCDQWRNELAEKFAIPAEVVRPGTVARLERGLGPRSLFEAHPFVVVSVDFIKSDRRRFQFLQGCPEFVIVDEAHTCAAGASQSGGQHQRHELVRDIAKDPARHLVLTTATPHSGVEAAFRSLIALLDPAFEALPPPERLTADDPLRQRLARHLVQRRRGDITAYVGEETAFPTRRTAEETWSLSPAHRRLFEQVLDYARELVSAGDGLTAYRQRVRWWAALALLRCVVSSPAAAAATLRTRASKLAAGEAETADDLAAVDALGERTVLDLDTADAGDADDTVPAGDAEADDASRERRRLQEMARAADALAGKPDAKLQRAAAILRDLLDDGFRPIVFCRYIATADSLAEQLPRLLGNGTTVGAVTGAQPEEERESRVADLQARERRVLVATDCLSEGINLQEGFDAVFHYDLSWNPTRHEQREGRVDRFGQERPEVRVVLFYGDDNGIDGRVMEVLLRKAQAIRTQLGVNVAVPVDSTKVMEAIFESVFRPRGVDQRQLALLFPDADRKLREAESAWKVAEEREKRSRTIFAQQTIQPDEVRRELREATEALGNHRDTEHFVLDAAARLGASAQRDTKPDQHPARGRGSVYRLPIGELPETVRERAGMPAKTATVGFALPLPDGATHLSRVHPLVEALATHLTDHALGGEPNAVAARCAAYRTAAVPTRTTVALLRVRMHLDVVAGNRPVSLLAEEAFPVAWRGRGAAAEHLPAEEAERLLRAEPTGPTASRERRLEEALADLAAQEPALNRVAEERAAAVLAAHLRVRQAANLSTGRHAVRPCLPVDVLGVYVLDREA